MPNRFISTGFFKSPFVRGLKGSLKSLYTFIITDCDGSGIWIKELIIAGEYIDFKITEKEFEDSFIKTGKAIDLKNGKYFFPDFIEHQYPKGLNDSNPAHNNFILELKKLNLIDKNLKVLTSPFEGTKVKVMVMDKVKEEVMVNEQKEKFNFLIFKEFIKIYPGTKRGAETEYDNFCKKHKDWKEILPGMKIAVEAQIKKREEKNLKLQFVPAWKNLQTWIKQRCWEEEMPIDNSLKGGKPKTEIPLVRADHAKGAIPLIGKIN